VEGIAAGATPGAAPRRGAQGAAAGAAPARARRGVPTSVALLAALLASGCATSGAGAIAERLAVAPARHVLAAELERVWARVDAGLDAGPELAAIWPHRLALESDEALREALRALPRPTVASGLARAWALEVAWQRLQEGDRPGARRLLAELPAPPGGQGAADPWTEGRIALALALVALDRAPAEARDRLLRLANAPPPGRLGAELGSLARLTLASRLMGLDDAQGAIAQFLRVDPSSGYWRRARVGLAMVQLGAGRAEPALKILALLPGGLVGEPERATLAAMAFHAVGMEEEARSVLEHAKATRDAWTAARADPQAVLAAVSEADGDEGGDGGERLARLVAASPAVHLVARELLAARRDAEEGSPVALEAYILRLERLFAAAVATEEARERERLAQAWRDLDSLDREVP